MTKRTLILGFCAFSVVACTPPDTRLFDESGNWSLIFHALDGGSLTGIQMSTQNNAFMLNFNSEVNLVAAAACSFSGSFSVLDSDCRQGTTDTQEWECRCFKYSYEESTMVWSEYAPGDAPPASVGGSDTDGGGGTTTITVSTPDGEEFPNGSRMFTPLPGPSDFDMEDGVFQSDGEKSSYVFLPRADNLFDDTGCREVCGFPGSGGETSG